MADILIRDVPEDVLAAIDAPEALQAIVVTSAPGDPWTES